MIFFLNLSVLVWNVIAKHGTVGGTCKICVHFKRSRDRDGSLIKIWAGARKKIHWNSIRKICHFGFGLRGFKNPILVWGRVQGSKISQKTGFWVQVWAGFCKKHQNTSSLVQSSVSVCWNYQKGLLWNWVIWILRSPKK